MGRDGGPREGPAASSRRFRLTRTRAVGRSIWMDPVTQREQGNREGRMRKSEQATSWAVYQVTILGQPGPNVVCRQPEWEELEREEPGVHRLIRGGITNEGEAERLARGSSGDDRRAQRKRAVLQFPDARPGADEPDDEGREYPAGDGPVMLPFSDVPPEVIEELAGPDGRAESA